MGKEKILKTLAIVILELQTRFGENPKGFCRKPIIGKSNFYS